MAPLIEKNKTQIAALCERFQVARLEVFGSAANGGFDPARSDVDFLVEFKSLEPGALADAYFGLLASLRDLLNRNVDLLTPKSVTNPFLRRSIDESRRMLYAA